MCVRGIPTSLDVAFLVASLRPTQVVSNETDLRQGTTGSIGITARPISSSESWAASREFAAL